MTAIDALVFDFDGTLVDSDDALIRPLLALGVPTEEITFGHAVAEECERFGIPMESYVDLYDDSAAQPFPGVDDVIGRLGRWAAQRDSHVRTSSPPQERSP